MLCVQILCRYQCYTKRHVYFYTAFDIVMISFLLILLDMKRSTKFVIITYLLVHPIVNYCNKYWYNLHPKQLFDEIFSLMIEIWTVDHLGSDKNCNTRNQYCPNVFTRNDK